MSAGTAEVLFYHLEHKSLDEVLPSLVEKTIERGWRAVVQTGSSDRIDALDIWLWSYREDSFVPHGTAKSGHAAHQPVYLTADDDNPNGATVRFIVDGAQPLALDQCLKDYTRLVYLFDGRDQHELGLARLAWKSIKAAGAAATYWQQNEQGRWEKKA
jgi:DNA polymerase III subunit chi